MLPSIMGNKMKWFKNLLFSLGIALFMLALTLFVLRDQPSERAADTPSASNQATQSTTSPPSSPAFDKQKYSLTDPTSIWVIANKQRPLNPLQYAPADLVSVGGSQQLRQEAAEALAQLFAAAKAENLVLNPLSGYRSYARQQVVYGNEVKNYGQAVADTESAKPGYSEHQTGWAIDVGGGGCGIENCFGTTPHGKWVAANAYKYGFIVRYPEGKQNITGYRYEPWHIRYVGVELATELHNQNILTLEEFFSLN